MEQIKQALREIYQKYGESVFANNEILKSLIEDLYLDDVDTTLLIRAIDCDVALDVISNVPAINDETQKDIIINHLISDLMWSEDKAIQAVDYFIYAKFGEAKSDIDPNAIDIENLNEQLKEAEDGDKELQYNLGKCYEKGLKTDLSKAFEWVKKAAHQGYVLAQYDLATYYEHGLGVEKNNSQAFHWYSTAASEGYLEAKRKIGPCYENGIGVDKNLTEAFNRYLQLAQNGHVAEQYKVAQCYEFGTGVTPDNKKAFNMYLNAAKQGHVESQTQVGLSYKNGVGTKKDNLLAFQWFLKASYQKYAPAQYHLAQCYELGLGTEKDDISAFNFYLDSANQNYADAQFKVGWFYAYYSNSSNDKGNKAINKLLKGNKKTDLNAPVSTPQIEKNYLKALSWFMKSAEQGNADAQKKIEAITAKGF